MRKLGLLVALVLISSCIIQGQRITASPGGFKVIDAYWLAPLTLGTNNTLVVKIKYVGSTSASSLNAQLVIEDVAGSDLTSTDSYTGSINQGVVIELRFSLDIPEGAKASYYSARLGLDYVAGGSSQSEEHIFQVGFLGEPGFNVTASTSTLSRGKTNKVYLTIKVSKAPARNVAVRVNPASAFVTVLGGSVNKPGLVEAEKSISVPVKLVVDSMAGDTVAISVSISYQDYSGNPGTETITIGFKVKAVEEPHISVSTSPTRVYSGRKTRVTLIIRNTGSNYAHDVYITVSPGSPGVAVLEGSSRTLGDIPPKGYARTSILVRIDREVTGTATLTLTATYMDDFGDTHVSTVAIGLEVARGAEPLITLYTPTTILPSGKETTLTLDIANIGDEEAIDVVVDVVSGQGVYVLGESRFYFENLDPEDNGTITLRVVASNPLEEPGAILNIRARYYDPYGNEYVDTFNIAFKIEEPGKPIIAVEAINDTLKPNSINTILLRLINNGTGAAVNITLSLASQTMEVASIVGVSTKTIVRLEPNSTVLVKYRVFVQPKVYGAIQLLATLDYEDEWGNTYSRLMALGYSVEGTWELSVIYVKTTPTVLFPGDKLVRVTATIANTGDYMARDVEIRLPGTTWIKPSTASGARAKIPYLPVGQSSSITFLVDIDEQAPPGNHELVLKMNGEREAVFQLTILEKVSFAVRNVTPVIVSPGEKGYKLLLEIENTSRAKAESVRIDLYSPFISGSTSTQVGSIEPGEKRLVVFEVDIDPSTPHGLLPIEVKVKWSQEGRSLYQTSTIVAKVSIKPIPIIAYAALAIVAFSIVIVGIARYREKLTTIFRRAVGNLKTIVPLRREHKVKE